MYYLLGIDDTDTEKMEGSDPGGTPALALDLGRYIESLFLAKLINISCHQLLQHPSIPHTNQNITCCVLLDVEAKNAREIDLICREKLLHESAPNANAGYALASWNQFDPEIVVWGKSAKLNPLNRSDALVLARRCNILMAGILGNGNGVIGALAAIGLRYEGNDGWIEWMPGLDGLKGIYTPVKLAQSIYYDSIETDQHKHPAMDDRIQVIPPLKPLILDGRIILKIKSSPRGSSFNWNT